MIMMAVNGGLEVKRVFLTSGKGRGCTVFSIPVDSQLKDASRWTLCRSRRRRRKSTPAEPRWLPPCTC